MRPTRAASVAFAALVLLAAGAPTVTAQNFPPRPVEPADPAEPGASRFTAPGEGETVTTDEPTIAGEFSSAVPLSDAEVKIGFARDDIAGCRLPGAASVPTEEVEPTRYAFEHSPSIECNGAYVATAIGKDPRSGPVAPISSEIGPREFTVAAPAAPVVDLAVVVNPDRTVTVTWAPGGDSPDYRGFQITRSLDGDVAAASPPSEATTFNDTTKAPTEGKLSYSVIALRSDGAGDLLSSEAAVGEVDLSTITDPTAPPGDGDGDGPGTGAGTGGSSTSGGSGGTSSSGSSAGGSGPPTTVDTGFNEELDYGDREPGSADAVLPDDLASTQRFDRTGPRGLLVPVALALVLVLGALHLRHINRLATRPALVPVAPTRPRRQNRPSPPTRSRLGPPAHR